MEIYVYFQDHTNRIRELRFGLEGREWYEDSPAGGKLPKGLGGTSIACAADSEYGVKRWVYNQSPKGGIYQSMYKADGDTWIPGTYSLVLAMGLTNAAKVCREFDVWELTRQKIIRISIIILPRALTATLDSDIVLTLIISECMPMMVVKCWRRLG